MLSTMSCIQLCVSGKPKRLALVRSTSTLDNEHYVRLSQQDRGRVIGAVYLEDSRKGLGTLRTVEVGE